MKILVLGGGGFIGSHLCDALWAAGHQVRVFEHHGVRPLCRPETLQHLEWMEGDFNNPQQVEQAIQGCAVIYHLISTTVPKNANDNPVYDAESNILPSIHLLQAAVRHQTQKVIFISSGGTVYGPPQQIPITESHPTNPISAYGISKLTIEKYLHLFHALHGLDYCILRLANPYGERQRLGVGQGAVATFLDKVRRRETIEIWGDGNVVRDYIYIADVITALICALQNQGGTRIFNVGSGIGISLNQMLDVMETMLGQPLKRSYLPSRCFDVPTNVLDIQQIRQTFGWLPQTDFTTGIALTLRAMSQDTIEYKTGNL